MMIKDNRRYYMDLKENARGRFLRVRNIMYCYTGFPAYYDDTKYKQISELKMNINSIFQVSQTITRGGPRSQIAIPAQGMIDFRNALTDLLEEFGTEDGGFRGELPEGRHMKVENKNFYFDVGQNNRGIYMRISEV